MYDIPAMITSLTASISAPPPVRPSKMASSESVLVESVTETVQEPTESFELPWKRVKNVLGGHHEGLAKSSRPNPSRMSFIDSNGH